jgi:voltage-gated potassium channel
LKKRTLFLLAVASTSLGINSSLFWCFEHGANPKVQTSFDAIWWWVVTSATVGYGDIVPATWQGRLVGIATIFLGIFSYVGLSALIIESAHLYMERRERGRAAVKARDHIVLCEYTAVADELIRILPESPPFVGREIVVVSDLVSVSPYLRHHFVHGVPLNPAALQKANVREAAYVFVFANLRFADPDIKALHTAARVHELNPRATILVELMDPGSPLLKKIPWPLVPLDSRKLMEAILTKGPINPSVWLAGGQATAHA